LGERRSRHPPVLVAEMPVGGEFRDRNAEQTSAAV
jgi:hypothetical protein